MMAETQPSIRPFDGSGIPDALKSQKRWAPWKAVWSVKRNKFDKIPKDPKRPEYGLSSANPTSWVDYDTALSAFKKHAPELSGVGYLMTGPHGIVGTDLDDCIVDGVIAPWAQEVVDACNTYTEVSPSGRGLRIFGEGDSADWNNHDVGIEVYGGQDARFLTMTGSHLKGTPRTVNPIPPGVLPALFQKYGRTKVAAADIGEIPDILPEMLLPDLADLDLPYFTRDFLTAGETRGDDRSGEVHSAAVALYQAGLNEQEVMSVLATNQFAMEVALDHRRQDQDRALLYLWKEHCSKGKAKAESTSRVAKDSDFEDVSDGSGPSGAAPGTPEQKAKKKRFEVLTVPTFLQRPKASWLVKGVLPKAGLAVVFGESGSGKTFFVLDMIAHIALGQEWRGKKVEQGSVIYICAEGVSGFRNRLEAYCTHAGVGDLPVGVIPDSPNLLEKEDVVDLVASIKAHGNPAIVVVDTFAQVMPGANENSGEDVGRALAHCKRIHKATGALVILVHHSGKDSSKGARGWSGLRAAADAEIEIERNDNLRCATLTKAKDGEDGVSFQFRLENVTLGQDDDGDDITSCVVAHGEDGVAGVNRRPPKGGTEKIVMRKLTEAFDLHGGGVKQDHLLDEVVSEMPLDPNTKRDRRRELANKAVKSLIASAHISARNDEITLN